MLLQQLINLSDSRRQLLSTKIHGQLATLVTVRAKLCSQVQWVKR